MSVDRSLVGFAALPDPSVWTQGKWVRDPDPRLVDSTLQPDPGLLGLSFKMGPKLLGLVLQSDPLKYD